MENMESVKKLAYDLAYHYETNYGCCPQCVIGALRGTIAPDISDDVFRCATGLGAGCAGAGYACGALTGGIMVLSHFVGRNFKDFPDSSKIREVAFPMVRKLVNQFEETYGVNGGDCSAVQTALMGRSYDVLNGDRDAFTEDGGHDDVCTDVCGKAAMWVIDILAEEGLI